MRRLVATGVGAPLVAGVVGGLGVWGARVAVDAAPAVVFAALALSVVAVVLRERGVALAVLGVGAASGFATPAGLGPILVAAGVLIAARPASVDPRVAPWPEIVDGLIALPALAGLASVVAAQPSERGLTLGAGAGVLAVLSWWRGPRHGEHEPDHATVIAYMGAVGGVMATCAPELFGVLGVLPDATVTAGHGLVTALAVFAIALVLGQLRAFRTNRATPTLRAAVRRR